MIREYIPELCTERAAGLHGPVGYNGCDRYMARVSGTSPFLWDWSLYLVRQAV